MSVVFWKRWLCRVRRNVFPRVSHPIGSEGAGGTRSPTLLLHSFTLLFSPLSSLSLLPFSERLIPRLASSVQRRKKCGNQRQLLNLCWLCPSCTCLSPVLDSYFSFLERRERVRNVGKLLLPGALNALALALAQAFRDRRTISCKKFLRSLHGNLDPERAYTFFHKVFLSFWTLYIFFHLIFLVVYSLKKM